MNLSKYPDKKLSATAARSQLQMLLCGCTDARLAEMTVDRLAAQYRVRRGEIETMLGQERWRRSHGRP